MASRTPKIRIRHRLLTRLLLSYILIASLPLLLTGKVLIDSSRRSIEETITERNIEITKRATRLIELKVETAKNVIRSQAKERSLYDLNRTTVELAINVLVNEYDLFKEITVLDTLRNVIATTSFDRDGYLSGANGLVSSVFEGMSFQSDVYVSRERLPLLNVAEPVVRYGEVVGALFAVVDLKEMWDLVQENVIGLSGEAFVFNEEGVYIAHSDPRKVYSEQRFTNPEIISFIAAKRNGRIKYRTADKVEMLAAYAPIADYGWGFMIQQPTKEAFALAESMRVRVIQFMIGTILLASLLAYFYSRWMVKPVDHLTSGMERFAGGEWNFRIEKVTNDEVGALAEHFNDMAERLVEYQNTLKRTERLETLSKLAAVLSHEIRNPLNSMVINMQILRRELSKPLMNRERVENFYGILSSEIKRVDKLVKDFLLIARPQSLQKSRIAIDEVLDEVIMMQSAESLKQGVRIEREYGDRRFYVEADQSKMKQVFLNLIINSIQAMPGGGKLRISIHDPDDSQSKAKSRKRNWFSVSFRDTGIGIKRNDLGKIFDFYYSTKEGGSGLGLAVVQQIIEEHQGKITVQSKVGKGTTFIVHLPKT